MSLKCLLFYLFPSVITVAGLLRHLHERVGAQGSSGTLYEGTSASLFASESTRDSGWPVDYRSNNTLVQGDFCTFILLVIVSFFFFFSKNGLKSKQTKLFLVSGE